MSWKTRKRGTPKQRGIRFQTSRGGSLGARARLVSEQMRAKGNHRYLTFDKKYNYWPVPAQLVRGGIKWGFDLSSVGSASSWKAFLKKHRFAKVDEAPHTHKGPAIYRNPDGIFIVTQYSQHAAKKRGEGGFLGYMRFEAPKSQSGKLTKILSDFRGPRELTFVNAHGHKWDYQKEDIEGGIATYVKEESPHDAQFI